MTGTIGHPAGTRGPQETDRTAIACSGSGIKWGS